MRVTIDFAQLQGVVFLRLAENAAKLTEFLFRVVTGPVVALAECCQVQYRSVGIQSFPGSSSKYIHRQRTRTAQGYLKSEHKRFGDVMAAFGCAKVLSIMG